MTLILATKYDEGVYYESVQNFLTKQYNSNMCFDEARCLLKNTMLFAQEENLKDKKYSQGHQIKGLSSINVTQDNYDIIEFS